MKTRQRRWACSLAGAAALALAAPASSPAAITIGSSLPAGGAPNECVGPCTFSPLGAPDTLSSSPIDGVVVRWRVRNMRGLTKFRILRHAGGNAMTGVATSDLVTVPEGDEIRVFDTRLPIRTGDYIGLDSFPGQRLAFRPLPGAQYWAWSPTLADGETRDRFLTGSDSELLVNADVEPDKDGDGYGDESQDPCPGAAGQGAPCPAPAPTPGPGPDVTPPVLSSVSVTNRVFAVAPATAAAVRRGTTFRYALSEPARVTFRLERRIKGRRVGARCRPQTRRNRARLRCSLHRRVGSFTWAGNAGANETPFSGRLGRRALRPGRYRVVLSAVDAAGQRSTKSSVSIRIVRG